MLDFLYSDHERIASFLTQLDGSGALTQVEQAGTKGKSERKDGRLNLGPIGAGGALEKDWHREVRQTYDPLWRNSLKLLELVTERTEIRPEQEGEIGQLRILSGSLLAYDLTSLTAMMQSEAMEDFIAGGIEDRDDLKERSAKAKAEIKKKEASVIRSFLRELPLGIGFILVTDIGHFWFSVRREFLSLYSLDVPLKFPLHVSGEWNVLGIVDALPEDHIAGIQPTMDKNIDGLIPAVVLHMLQVAVASTVMFGRPLPAHGLNPLLIYRSISI